MTIQVELDGRIPQHAQREVSGNLSSGFVVMINRSNSTMPRHMLAKNAGQRGTEARARMLVYTVTVTRTTGCVRRSCQSSRKQLRFLRKLALDIEASSA